MNKITNHPGIDGKFLDREASSPTPPLVINPPPVDSPIELTTLSLANVSLYWIFIGLLFT